MYNFIKLNIESKVIQEISECACVFVNLKSRSLTLKVPTRDFIGKQKSSVVKTHSVNQGQDLEFISTLHVFQGSRSYLNCGAIIPSRDAEDCINHLSLQKLLSCISATCGLFYE